MAKNLYRLVVGRDIQPDEIELLKSVGARYNGEIVVTIIVHDRNAEFDTITVETYSA